MARPTATVEVKPSAELKELFDRVPAELSERLAEVERVLVELCDRNGIAFNVDQSRIERDLQGDKVVESLSEGYIDG